MTRRTTAVSARGIECVVLATQLLQRVRLAHPTAGVWEAVDVQWWWRRVRVSDTVDQTFVLDDEGPVAAALLTEWGDEWQLDPVAVPGHAAPVSDAVALARTLGVRRILTAANETDEVMRRHVERAGFIASEVSAFGWMDAHAFATEHRLPAGYRITSRASSPGGRHWLEARSGSDVEARLRECSLYDPALDLAVFTGEGDIAAYALLWFDPVTHVGMVEPMRTEDGHQRRGLARSILVEGFRRLIDRGASRLKAGYADEGPGALYRSLGFQPEQRFLQYVLESV